MHRVLRLFPWFAVVGFACVGHAAVDAYLKIDGVDGEVTDSKHPKWIQVLSFNQGATSPSATTGRPSFSGFCLLKLTDGSSPVLEQSCARGKYFPAATLELISADAGRARYYQIILSNVVVTGVSASGAAGVDKPAESVCLGFSQIRWTYTEFDATGSPKNDVKAWWDTALNLGGNNVTPVLRVTGTQVSSNSLQLSWPALAGKTYNILSSPVVTGQYQLVQSILAPGDGPMSLPLPMTGNANFFRVQEAP